MSKKKTRKRLYRQEFESTTFAHFSANATTNDNGYGRAPVGVDARTTMVMRYEKLDMAIQNIAKVLTFKHVGLVGGDKETIGPSNVHLCENIPWTFVRVNIPDMPEKTEKVVAETPYTLKPGDAGYDREDDPNVGWHGEDLTAENAASAKMIAAQPVPKTYAERCADWREDADAKVLHLTGGTRKALHAKLKAMGYGWYQVDKCWRTRSDGTPAIGMRSRYGSEHVGTNIAFAERKTAAAAA